MSLRRRVTLKIASLTKPRAHFLHIGKTGGSAVRAALAPPADTRGRFLIIVHSHHFTLADVPEGERFFFAVRDPISRFVSAFASRQRQGRPAYDSPWSPAEAEAFGRFATANDLAEALGRGEPDAEAAMGSIEHVRSPHLDWFGSVDALRARHDDLLMVVRQEHLDDDFAVLRDRLGLPGARLPADPVTAHQTPAGVDRPLSEPARSALARWYADDIAFVTACHELANGAPAT